MSPSDKYKIITQYGWVLGTRSQWLMWSKRQRGSIDLFGLLRRRLPNLFYVWKPMFEPPSPLLSLIYIYIYIYVCVCVCVCVNVCMYVCVGTRAVQVTSCITLRNITQLKICFFYMQILTNLSLNYLRAIVKNPFKESFYGKKSN